MQQKRSKMVPLHQFAVSLIVLFAILPTESTSSKPNILFIVADDLGWNDVGFNNPDMITPNIDSLANQGIILNQSYVQPLCSPSRSAFMTGIYPWKMGLQHLVIGEEQDVCVPLDKTMLPQVLKNNGYSNHLVGKWHLGYCRWECTPTYRGFDSFYGFYNYGEDYYNKTVGRGYDFRFNRSVEFGSKGTYSTYDFSDRAKYIINAQDPNEPLFLYLAFQSMHEPLQVPAKFANMYPNITRHDRKIFSGMVTAMDQAVGEVIAALKQKGIYDNTLIFFTSDNGGWTPYGGNNYPLRGGKVTVFEGGTRVPAFIHGSMLPKTGHRHEGMIHAVDLFPTLIEASGIKYADPAQDGVSQWSAITTNGDSPRNEIVYNMDLGLIAAQGRTAIRVGDYKLIEGYPGLFQYWYQPNDTDQGPDIHLHDLNQELIVEWASGKHPDVFDPHKSYNYLFNLKDDPEERNDLFSQMPAKVAELKAKLAEHRKYYVAPNFPPADPEADPVFYSGTWSPGWC